VQRLTQTGQFNRESLIAAATAVTQESLAQFIAGELAGAYTRLYLFGNYTQSYANELAEMLSGTLSAGESGGYQRPAVYAPKPGSRLVYQEALPIEDLGMLYLFAAPEATIENLARGELVSAHLSSRAFNQLRTEEQLGYAAGGFATELGDHPMLGLYIQTPVKAPVEMLTRFDAYRSEFAEDMEALTDEDFSRIKAGVITTLTEPPKNLSEEAAPFVSDWTRERYDFDTRARLIAAVEAVTLEEARAYYRDTMLAEDSARILIQLKGTKFADAPFATLADAVVVEDVDAFHRQMPTQQR
jgi:protease-3